MGKGNNFYLDSQVMIPVPRSELINSISSSRIWRFQGETESPSHVGEKASPELINNWQIGMQQRALKERQALFGNCTR